MTEKQIHRCGYAAIIGRPNVGKSTLLNRLIGQKLAITSHKAQTSRHALIGIKTLPEGQILYVDTPGIHQRGESAINRYLNRSARSVLADVDVLIFVVEALKLTPEDELVLKDLQKRKAPVILAINKIDQVKEKQQLLPFISRVAELYPFAEIIPVSALKGVQVDVLEQATLKRLPEGESFFPEEQVTDRSERFFAAELLREQLTRRYADELPYAVSVQIEEFKEEKGIYHISAIIWVERPGQKAILLGKKGTAMKETAQRAREEMEKFFGTKVNLKVWIKVKKSWSSDESALVRLGYGE
ncbi:MAG TPA: GTPase Era [Chromatiales bacterium]|nr:GTPase Era [Chromatiales bacterium]